MPGTYVMNRGRAADTLILQANGHYRRIYAMPGQTVAVDTGAWSATTLHGDEWVTFTTFWPRWRAETETSTLYRFPLKAGPWQALPGRTLTGRLQMVVDEDIEWSYVQRGGAW